MRFKFWTKFIVFLWGLSSFSLSIKNNENLKQSLANAKEKSYNGFVSAQAMAGTAATSMKDNANTLMEKNYHGQLAEGVGKAMTNA